ncbi:ectonucleoside triphosphate diphosphohydrolase 8-like isoform X1 [Haliotis asinina]|uniref:ectonucleoside triphosphate diphosphohydrolase 8-like isoform X1 n=1 Tax=Haliotis asinina TaxID=109174 RepID=UPI0035322F06
MAKFYIGSLIFAAHLYSIVTCVNSNGETRFGVMLDAGSSGTKIKVYEWQDTRTATDIPSMELRYGHKFSPGIGRYATHREGLTKYLSNIVAKAKDLVPEEKWKSTPMYLMATAGARILDGDIALGLLNRIRNILSNTTLNPFRFRGRNVRILSGEEEGVFAWISLNAVSGFFSSVKPMNESLGLLEMGGGSTQIAFIPSTPLYAGEFQIFLGGRRFDLYAHSYLFFGSNYIEERVKNILMARSPQSQTIDHPCRLIGDDINGTSDSGQPLKFQGTSEPSKCIQILRQLLSRAPDDRCYPKPCAIGSVYQPSIGNMLFYATQGFVYTPNTMGSLDADKHLNITHLRDASIIYCQKSFEDAMAEYSVKARFASVECLMGLYIPLLLQESYQFDPQTSNIVVENKILGNRIDWTMGALLYELNMMFQPWKLLPHTPVSCQPISFTPFPGPPAEVRPNSAVVPGHALQTLLLCVLVVLLETGH